MNMLNAEKYVFIIKDNLSSNVKVGSNWKTGASFFSDWINYDYPFDHTTYTQLISDQTSDFVQTREYKQKQERYEQPREY